MELGCDCTPANTLFKTENDCQKTELVPIPLPRASRNFPRVKTTNSFLVLTSEKFLETLGIGIGTGLVFGHSFSVTNNVPTEVGTIIFLVIQFQH